MSNDNANLIDDLRAKFQEIVQIVEGHTEESEPRRIALDRLEAVQELLWQAITGKPLLTPDRLDRALNRASKGGAIASMWMHPRTYADVERYAEGRLVHNANDTSQARGFRGWFSNVPIWVSRNVVEGSIAFVPKQANVRITPEWRPPPEFLYDLAEGTMPVPRVLHEEPVECDDRTPSRFAKIFDDD